MPLMTQSEYARHRRVSAARITQLKRRLRDGGCINAAGMIISEKADVFLDSELNKAKARNQQPIRYSDNEVPPPEQEKPNANPCPTCGCSVSESDARAIKLLAEAQRQEIALKKEQGLVLDANAVRRAAFDRGRKFRDAIMALPARIGDELASITSPFDLKLRLSKELEQALLEESSDV